MRPAIRQRPRYHGRYIHLRQSVTDGSSRVTRGPGETGREMTEFSDAPGTGEDPGGLDQLAGLEVVAGQLERWFAAVRAEQARRQAGAAITRPAWKNLVFAGGPGVGKSRAARAVARRYQDLGILAYGHVDEVAAADLAGPAPGDTAALIADAASCATTAARPAGSPGSCRPS